MIEDKLYLINLYDYYCELLTEKQSEYFKEYYFDNLSLSEIAENKNISRNAIHKQLKEVETKLKDYENKLKLYEKSIKIKAIISSLDEDIKLKIKELI